MLTSLKDLLLLFHSSTCASTVMVWHFSTFDGLKGDSNSLTKPLVRLRTSLLRTPLPWATTNKGLLSNLMLESKQVRHFRQLMGSTVFRKLQTP